MRSNEFFQHAVAAFQENRPNDAIGYLKQALAADAQHARAHRLLGLLLGNQGQYEQALASLDKALACQPDLTQAHGERGDMLMNLGRYEDAIASYDLALGFSPNSFGDWLNRGAALCELARFEQAVESFDRSIALNPDFPRAHFNRGNALSGLAQYEEAIVSYDRALALDRGLIDALINRGNAFRNLDRQLDALASYEAALKINPRSANALSNAASVLLSVGRHTESIDKYNQTLSIEPDLPEARYNLGNALVKLGRHEDAAQQYLAVLSMQPDHEAARLNLAQSLLTLGEGDAALGHCKAVIEQNPGFTEAHFNLAGIFKMLGRYEESVAAYEHTIGLRPDYFAAHDCLGLVLDQLERPADAVAAYDQALSIRPEYPQTLLNKGVLFLSRGRFAEGWPLMEHRWLAEKVPRRSYSQPRWNGGDVDGTLLIWADQGLGDQIRPASMISELLDKATQLVVDVEPRLVPLFARSFPRARVVASQSYFGPVTQEECLSDVGRHLRDDWAKFPRLQHGFLKPDEKRVKAFRDELRTHGGRVIGLSWISKSKTYGRPKTALLRDFESILKLPNTSFVDLQYGDTQEERQQAERELGVTIKRLAGLDTTNDIDGLAALIAACDAVVSVSNTTAHLAGALGQQTWVAVPHGESRLWYWFKGDGDSPWYPSVRVRSQQPRQSWNDLISKIAQEVS